MKLKETPEKSQVKNHMNPCCRMSQEEEPSRATVLRQGCYLKCEEELKVNASRAEGQWLEIRTEKKARTLMDCGKNFGLWS